MTKEIIYNDIFKNIKKGNLPKEHKNIKERIEKLYSDSLKNDDKRILVNLIGSPGVGKTHIAFNLDFIKNEKTSLLNFKHNNLISNRNLYVDGLNEFSKEAFKRNVVEFSKNENIKFILITCWEPIEIEGFDSIINIGTNFTGDSEKIAKSYNKFIPNDQKHFYDMLNFRQLHLIFENIEQKILDIDSWDVVQKAFESIINKLNIKKEFGSRSLWWEFKKNFVENNNIFPYVEISEGSKWLNELKVNSVIQSTKNKDIFYINNDFFLAPVLLREEIPLIKNNEIQKLKIKNPVIQNENLAAIHIFLSATLSNTEYIELILNDILSSKIRASIISGFLLKSYEKNSKLKIDCFNKNIEYDSLESLIQLSVFIDNNSFKNFLIYDDKAIFRKEQIVSEHTIEKIWNIYSINDERLHFSVIATDIFSNEIFDFSWSSKILNKAKMSNEFMIEIIIPENNEIEDYMKIRSIIYEKTFLEFGYKVRNAGKIESELQFIFRSNSNKIDFENFQSEVENYLNKLMSISGIDEKGFESLKNEINNFAYFKGKNSILEHSSYVLSKINPDLSSDKYKNTFLDTFLLFTILCIDPKYYHNNLSGRKTTTLNDINYYSNIEEAKNFDLNITLLWRRIIDYFCNFPLMEYHHKNSIPYFESELMSFDENIESILSNLNDMIEAEFFLKIFDYKEILRKLIYIDKNGIKWFPINIQMNNNSNSKNYFTIDCSNAFFESKLIFSEHLILSQSEVAFPIRFQNEKIIDERKMYIFHKSSFTDTTVVYTSLSEVYNRYFVVYFDSLKKSFKNFPKENDYDDLRILINWNDFEILSEENYEKKFSHDYEDEWKKYYPKDFIEAVEE